MSIHWLLQKYTFDPDEIRALVSAYEDILTALGLSDRADPITEMVACKVIEVARTGQSDPARIKHAVLKQIASQPGSSENG